MKKYEVDVKVNWYNMFVVNAESKEEAAAKVKKAMEEIMRYIEIEYDEEDDYVVWNNGCDNIEVVEINEHNEDEEA